MEQTRIMIFLDEALPDIYTNPVGKFKEEPVKDVDELCSLYETKYGSFGQVNFYIYKDGSKEDIALALNKLFARAGMEIVVDEDLLEANKDKLLPMIVVDDEIISKGVYPDLTIMRGGSNSVNRGGSGGHHDH